jgi:hypothetical protein
MDAQGKHSLETRYGFSHSAQPFQAIDLHIRLGENRVNISPPKE